jgi:hypothetical protein
MNFIEIYFGLSPDGGDGSMEIIVLVLLVALGALIGLFLPIAEKTKDDVRCNEIDRSSHT